MNNPELFHKFNELTRVNAIECLNEYSARINWRQTGDTIIDLGCGDGAATSILKKYIPEKLAKFYVCDINKNMLDFAKQYLRDENITYRIQDVEGDLAEDLVGGFNHVFAFFLIHWIENPEKAFSNMYKILAKDGDCLLTFFGYTSTYHVYDILSRDSKWGNTWLKNNKKRFQSPYYNVENPVEKITELLHNIGFTNVDVQCKKKIHNFENGSSFVHLLRSVDPYNMPPDVFEDFMEDFVKVAKDIGFVSKSVCCKMIDIKEEIALSYSLIYVYANKTGEKVGIFL